MQRRAVDDTDHYWLTHPPRRTFSLGLTWLRCEVCHLEERGFTCVMWEAPTPKPISWGGYYDSDDTPHYVNAQTWGYSGGGFRGYTICLHCAPTKQRCAWLCERLCASRHPQTLDEISLARGAAKAGIAARPWDGKRESEIALASMKPMPFQYVQMSQH